MFATSSLTGSKPEQYAQLTAQAQALVHGEPDRIANAANLAALIFNSLPSLNWAGFYFYDGRELVVGPFQGLPACVRIPLDKVCAVRPPVPGRLSASPMWTRFPGISPVIRRRGRSW